MSKCKNCGKEVSKKAIYCSDKCRMQYKRTTRTEQPEQNPNKVQPEQANPNRIIDLSLLPFGVVRPTFPFDPEVAEQQEQQDADYKEDRWKHSPQYAELIWNLLNLSLTELKDKGFWIPNWRESIGEYCQREARP
jgi:hypothetical protein